MASRNFDDLQALGTHRKLISGAFAPNGTGAPTKVGSSHGWTVARTGVGTIDVTFVDPYSSVDSWSMDLASATLTATAQMTAVPTANNGSGGGGKFTVTTMSSGSAADLAADANTVVSFQLVFANSNSY